MPLKQTQQLLPRRQSKHKRRHGSASAGSALAWPLRVPGTASAVLFACCLLHCAFTQTSSNKPVFARQSGAHERHWHSDYCHEAQPMRHLPLLLIAALCLPCAASAQDNPATLEQVLQAQDRDSHGDLRAVVVLRAGAIVAERYYNGETADTLHDIRSAGKSITALLVGAAVARGQLAANSRIDSVWPAAQGTALQGVTLDQVLTMRSGLAAFDEDPASPGNEDN